MNSISIPSTELKTALAGFSKVVSRKSTLPVLQSIRLARDIAGKVSLSATDLDAFVTYQVEQPCPGPEVEVLLPYDELNKTVKGLSGDMSFIPESKNRVKLKYVVSSSELEKSLDTIEAKEFPPLPKITTPAIKLPATFGETLKQAFETSSNDSSRYILNGAYLDVSQPKCHSIVSTNGRSLFAANSFTFDLKEGVNLTKHKFLTWSGFLDGECEMSVQPNKTAAGQVQFTTPRWNCIIRQIEGNYPNWRNAVPQDTENWTKVVLTDAAISQILSLSSKLPGDDTADRTLHLRVEQNLYLEGKNKEDKDFTSVLIAGTTITGKPVTTALNREYLQQALKCGLNEIRIHNELEALVVSNQGKRMVIMPVRLQAPATKAPEPKPAQVPTPATTPTQEPERKTEMAKETKPEPVKPAEPSTITSLVDQAEQIKETLRNAIRDLNGLVDSVRLAEKEKRANEKEIEAARSVLKKLQQVTI